MTRDAARRYVIAYDVPDDRRRLQLAKKLGSYGDRVQYSVFIVDVRPAKLVRLRMELIRLINPTEDSVLLCEIGPVSRGLDGRYEVIGRERPVTEGTTLIF
ncbi:MAG TPA: CRISPR-associated endonuclease Cas2 [Patescibacteria group bacterium]|nr:CRISPR-associated endonuclease Cas2 [Patescibacteria group bacterium]